MITAYLAVKLLIAMEDSGNRHIQGSTFRGETRDEFTRSTVRTFDEDDSEDDGDEDEDIAAFSGGRELRTGARPHVAYLNTTADRFVDSPAVGRSQQDVLSRPLMRFLVTMAGIAGCAVERFLLREPPTDGGALDAQRVLAHGIVEAIAGHDPGTLYRQCLGAALGIPLVPAAGTAAAATPAAIAAFHLAADRQLGLANAPQYTSAATSAVMLAAVQAMAYGGDGGEFDVAFNRFSIAVPTLRPVPPSAVAETPRAYYDRVISPTARKFVWHRLRGCGALVPDLRQLRETLTFPVYDSTDWRVIRLNIQNLIRHDARIVQLTKGDVRETERLTGDAVGAIEQAYSMIDSDRVRHVGGKDALMRGEGTYAEFATLCARVHAKNQALGQAHYTDPRTIPLLDKEISKLRNKFLWKLRPGPPATWDP